jgi:hypothetical protein
VSVFLIRHQSRGLPKDHLLGNMPKAQIDRSSEKWCSGKWFVRVCA